MPTPKNGNLYQQEMTYIWLLFCGNEKISTCRLLRDAKETAKYCSDSKPQIVRNIDESHPLFCQLSPAYQSYCLQYA